MTAYQQRLAAGHYLPPKPKPEPKPEQEPTTEKLDDTKPKDKDPNQ